MRLPRPLRLALFSSLVSLLSFRSFAAEEKPTPALALQSIHVEPAAPGPETLCHLAVTVKNAGERPASALEMEVKVGGRELPAYRGRVFLMPLEPGASRQLRLFNFWTTESGRPAPAGGKLVVEVILTKASWMRRETRDGATVWTPEGAVPGLPSSQAVTLALAKAKK